MDAARLVLESQAARRGFSSSARALSANRSRRRRVNSALAIDSCSSGSRSDVAAVLSAFDLSVFPSLWEGTPLTVFEALAAGKTDRRDRCRWAAGRSHRSAATRGSCPSATPGRSPDAIVDLMNRPDERARLAAAARVTAQRYDIAAFVRKMEQLYVLLCDGSRARKAGGRANLCGPICPFLA